MKKYAQLTHEQRYHIYALKKTGSTQIVIAEEIGVHKSTISRELKRNRGQRGYRPDQAQRLACARRDNKAKPLISPGTWETVDSLLCQDYSPEQVSGFLKKEQGPKVSHERIYQHILDDKRVGGKLHTHLRCQKKKKKRYGTNSRRGLIPDRVSIDQRPAIVESRSRIGDWEADTIIGKNHSQAIVSLVERKSKLTLIKKVARNTAEAVKEAIIELLMPLSHHVLTITSDNGKEFAAHKDIANALKADLYFAHPYHSWERGLNENTNGLIRQYFPKGTTFDNVTGEQVEAAMKRLNDRPRKSLGFMTPNQVFYKPKSVALET